MMTMSAQHRGRVAAPILALVLAMGAASCERSPDLETATLPLQNMSASAAMKLARPYLVGTGGVVQATNDPPVMTVHGTAASVAAIRELLARYDRPPASVRLHFQIIEADGFQGTDPAIADVEDVLRGLFRFHGYRLAADAVLSGTAGNAVQQSLSGPDGAYVVRAYLNGISRRGSSPIVTLSATLSASGAGKVIDSSVAVADGQTVVLGSAQPDAKRAALILVVRPTITEAAPATEPAAADTVGG